MITVEQYSASQDEEDPMNSARAPEGAFTCGEASVRKLAYDVR